MIDLPENGPFGEGELKRLFQEMKALDQARAPGFARMMERIEGQLGEGRGAEAPGPSTASLRGSGPSGARPRWHRLGWAGGLLAAAAVSGLLLARAPTASEAEFEQAVRAFSADPAGGAWRSPTDGLLSLPGQEMLTTLPSIGAPDWPGSMRSSRGRNQL